MDAEYRRWPWPGLTIAALVTLGCVVVYAMPNLSYPMLGLEGGWYSAMNRAAASHMVFGRDVIFTFGPYAGIFTGEYDPVIDQRLFAGSLVLALAMAGGLLCLARGMLRGIVVAVPVFMLLVRSYDALLLALPAALLLVGFRLTVKAPHPSRLTHGPVALAAFMLLVLAQSLLPLVKGTFGMAAFGEVAVVFAMLAWRRAYRLATAELVVFVGGLVGWWWLIGQPISALPGYFMAQAPIISGYSEAMAIGGPLYQPMAIGFGSLALLCIVSLGVCRRAGGAGIGLMLGLALLSFIAFKSGVVRQDRHIAISAGVLGILGWLVVFELRFEAAAGALLLSLACWGAVAFPMAGGNGAPRVPGFHRDLTGAGRDLARRLFDRAALGRDYQAALGRIRQRVPFQDAASFGSVDVYPLEQTLALAYGLAWAPRPVVQSYSAYTPTLARANAAHLLGPAAPDTVLLRIGAIDDRLPALEDAPSWPVLLQRYRIDSLQASYAVLRRRDDGGAVADIAQPDATVPIVQASPAMGEWLPLPPGQPLWAEIALRPTWLGSMANFLLKSSTLTMSLRYADGSVRQFRYVASMGETGFVLSPTIVDVQGFVGLATPPHVLATVTSAPVAMAIAGSSGTRVLWPSHYGVTLRPFLPPPQPAARALLVSTLTPADGSAVASAGRECAVDEMAGPQIKGILRLRGWSTIAAAKGIAAEAMRVTLVGAGGVSYSAAVRRTARPDVAEAFHHPEMIATGYDATLDVAGLTGSFTVAIDMDRQGATMRCMTKQTVLLGSKSAG